MTTETKRQRGNGIRYNEVNKTWFFRFSSPTPKGAPRKQPFYGGFKTKKAAELALAKMRAAVGENTYVAPSKESFGEYLDRWLNVHKGNVRQTTASNYEQLLRVHVKPRIGMVKLQNVTSFMLQQFYVDLATDGKQTGKRGALSSRTIRYVHSILKRALHDAEGWGDVSKNAAMHAKPPKSADAPSAIHAWSQPELKLFLTNAKEHELYPLFLLAATTGMRRGELCGLRWTDIDFVRGTLTIQQNLVIAITNATDDVHKVKTELVRNKPKTNSGRRTIDVDAHTLAVLREHGEGQMKTLYGIFGDDATKPELVFSAIDSTGGVGPVHPEVVSDTFRKLAKSYGLPVIRFHDIRHTYATLALASGEPVKVVSERLGHANISITLQTYAHVTPGMGKATADRMASFILT